VLGAGGASKAAIVAMLEHGANITVANRTVEKAKELATEFGISYSSLNPEELKKELAKCSIIIGCLSTGERVIPKELLKPEMAIFDAYYSVESYLVKDGKEVGCKMIDAGDWLVYQGLLAFELFTGKKAPEKAMRIAVQNARLSQGQRNISLVGFMGSGKDTIAKEIAGKTEQVIFDIDMEIENMAGKSIKEIFEIDGEDEFRTLESRVLSNIKNQKNIIVNCGGGVIMKEKNRKLLKENSLVVWLWASPKTILDRLPKDGSRPLLEVDNPIQVIEKLLGTRKCQYAEVADLVINTDGKNPKEISERILYEIDKTFKN
jgi:shikimate dehydrogenase